MLAPKSPITERERTIIPRTTPSDFVTRIVGAELVRIRSQTTYYVLSRIKGICKVYLDRQRMAVA